MAWRDTLFRWFNPGNLSGISFGDWLTLLRANRFDVDPEYWPRAVAITASSLVNSLLGCWERNRFARFYEQVEVEPPIFIVGIPRSGTTHLHSLLAVDQRFAYPNFYEIHFPHIFLSTESFVACLISPFLPAKRLQDNVRMKFQVPGEDEAALCALTSCSPLLSGVFPRRSDFYLRYYSFREVPLNEIARWKMGLTLFLKKLAWKHRRPLILKSPGHLCRLRLLSETFPGAKFVHIHRHPYDVIRSVLFTQQTLRPYRTLQDRPVGLSGENIVERYRIAFEVFFEERCSLPKTNLHELSYEDLEGDPLGQVHQIYESLDLPGFADMEPALRSYLHSVSDYQRNVPPEISPELRALIARKCGRFFREYGYEM